jgi:hypothetical protein
MAVATMTAPVSDIRETLPVATKGGTASKPVWDIDGEQFKFVKAVNKKGLDAEQSKVRLGKRILAKYEVATTSPTVPGGKLWFVGVFAKVK